MPSCAASPAAQASQCSIDSLPPNPWRTFSMFVVQALESLRLGRAAKIHRQIIRLCRSFWGRAMPGNCSHSPHLENGLHSSRYDRLLEERNGRESAWFCFEGRLLPLHCRRVRSLAERRDRLTATPSISILLLSLTVVTQIELPSTSVSISSPLPVLITRSWMLIASSIPKSRTSRTWPSDSASQGRRIE